MTESTPPPSDPSQAPQTPGTPPPTFDPAELTNDEKTMAMLGHMLAIIGGFIAPLIIWLVKKDQSAFINDQGKEALNFQLTLLIGWVVVIILSVITCGVGALLVLPMMAVVIIFAIMAGLKAKEGIAYRYPFCIRFIS